MPTITIRITELEKADLAQAAGRAGVTLSDYIRNTLRTPTITVGGIASVDDVNTIILAGRADLCAIARPHLLDPYWTLNAALDQHYDGHVWPMQYLSGQTARRRAQDPFADALPAARRRALRPVGRQPPGCDVV